MKRKHGFPELPLVFIIDKLFRTFLFVISNTKRKEKVGVGLGFKFSFMIFAKSSIYANIPSKKPQKRIEYFT